MNYLSVENLSKNYGEKTLFENLNFGLSRGDKFALIANNGTGKTTLLKIIAGKDTPDAGGVAFKNGVRIGFLEQEPQFNESQSINELLNGANSQTLKIIAEYELALENQTENFTDETQKAFEVATAKMDEVDAWDYERKVKQILSKFQIPDLEIKIHLLSGGQKKRLALALVLLDNPELLILDEPTNHLDIDMIEWLEKYLMQQNITLLMVTHDRYFLDRVCNHILELNDGKLYHHKGNYSYFLQKRAEREEVYNVEISKAGKLMKSELEWMRKMPKARGTKAKSRVDAFYETEKKATSKKPTQELKLEVKMSRIGGKILELKKVYKSYGDLKIMNNFDYTFKKGERIGIVGRNGVGKTTFLNIITQQELPDSGSISVGETIVYGYFSQKGIQIKEDKRVIEVLKDIAEYITMGDGKKLSASQLLEQFLFTPDMQYTYVSKLSGGEKRRLYLLTVLITNPNFLILDEPTNDLDLLTLNKLEEFLESYSGCVMLVTHDRYFMDKLVDHLFIFEGNGAIKDFNGTYTEYRNDLEDQEQEQKQASKKIDKEDKTAKIEPLIPEKPKLKLNYKLKLEFETLEKEIPLLEKNKKELENQLVNLSENYEKMTEISQKIGKIIDLIDGKTMRWLEIEEMSNE